ncbi:E3 ubiquitin-protein ligase TRIM39-like isoform X2 [Narcine bancroftii]|uniref:E3 ubiquitin-protein ligase TRIM39-like isoform X2 n=1 Tax=Narcine bancroftii TaxID=1343680 RepID=UPI0038316767
MIDCGHNFCKECILDYWGKQKGKIACPKCREECPEQSFRINRFAATMVESARKLRQQHRDAGDPLCSLHEEKLKLFCERDKAAICVVCAVSQEHKEHKISPLRDVAEIYKGKLQSALEFLNNQVDEISKSQVNQQSNVVELKRQADDMRKYVELEFTNLRQYLHEEEMVLMNKVKQKEDDILQQLQDNLRVVSVENSAVNQRILDIQRRMGLQEAELLKDVKMALEGAEMPYIKPAEVRVDLKLHEPIGPLQYIVWKRMLRVINPVPASLTLDPETAHPRLILSEGDTQVRRGDWRKVPELPERFSFLLSVLAQQGFSTGRHYWEVDVSGNTAWDVGATKSSVTRKSIPESGIWAVGLWDQEYSAFTNPRTSLSLDVTPE